jgi:hypothetical protein
MRNVVMLCELTGTKPASLSVQFRSQTLNMGTSLLVSDETFKQFTARWARQLPAPAKQGEAHQEGVAAAARDRRRLLRVGATLHN